MFGKERHIAAPFSERWNVKRDDAQAIKEVFTKCSGFNFPLKVTIRRRNHARIDMHGARCADAPDPSFLKRAQEFDLHRRTRLANFGEKERASLSLFLETFAV